MEKIAISKVQKPSRFLKFSCLVGTVLKLTSIIRMSIIADKVLIATPSFWSEFKNSSPNPLHKYQKIIFLKIYYIWHIHGFFNFNFLSVSPSYQNQIKHSNILLMISRFVWIWILSWKIINFYYLNWFTFSFSAMDSKMKQIKFSFHWKYHHSISIMKSNFGKIC